MRIFGDDNYYWVWSRNGPAETGLHFGRTFHNGMIPVPMPGDIAMEMESLAYVVKEYEPGTWFKDWELKDGTWTPVFAKVDFVKPKRKRGRPKKSEAEVNA